MGIIAQPLDPAGFRPAASSSPIEMYYSAGTAANAYVTGAAYPSSGSFRYAQYYFAAESYGAGASITIDLTWFPLTATSGTATWSVQLAAQAPNSSTIVTSSALATAVTANTTINGTNKSYLTSITLTGASLASVANSYDCFLRVERTDTSIADTLVLYGLVVSYSDGLSGTAGSGDVVGPASATDSAFARFDLTTGKLIKNSAVVCDASGNLTGLGTLNTRTIANWVDGPASSGSNTVPVFADTTGKLLGTTGYSASTLVRNGAATTTTAIAKWGGTGGNFVIDTGVLIDASNNITGAGTLNTRTIANWVDGPGSAVSGNIVTFSGTSGKIVQDSGSSIASVGDFDGPGSSVSGNVVSFSGTSGKIGQDSGVAAGNLVAVASPSTGDIARYNGSSWSPKFNANVSLSSTVALTGATAWTLITGLSVAVPRTGRYRLEAYLAVTTSGTASTHFYSWNMATGTQTFISGMGLLQTTSQSGGAPTNFAYHGQTANSTAIASSTANSLTTMVFRYFGTVVVSATGNIQLGVAKGSSALTCTYQPGSWFLVEEVS